ncbi:DUF1801 domain-containing protein [Pseudoflavitalea sp. X16]|uniref:iron chaperone n=1 Tax=Paraflavitalea devenefica TaxID=2716334 RepID=UPI001421CC98|nr:DUF1801 domain-containing protein [Paraflavitalea devenefica]NII27625.1 DUF1801 domain-containing protein [Paraflavitalea devenefica]
MEATKWATVHSYISKQPSLQKSLLKEMREIIKSVVPKAEEVISYNMPAFKQHYVLVWYAAYKNHIGFYPSSAIAHFKNELTAYKTSKGAIQFPVDQPLPVSLIKKIVKFKVKEDVERAQVKALKAKSK